jgi:hypothetical protein
MKRFAIALAIGGVLGLALGVYLGWVQFPVQTINGSIRSLSPVEKDRYTVMVAEGYEVDGNVDESIRRLQLLGVSDVPGYVRDVTERFISVNGSGDATDIRQLVALAQALHALTPPMQAFAPPTGTPLAQ